MKTLTKGLEVKKALEIVKPFVGSLRKKFDPRPVLKTALVTENHITATDASILIRIKHGEEVQEPYIHSYKGNEFDLKQFPQVERLFPDIYNAQLSFKMNIAEWLEAHSLALIAAKEHKNKVTRLEGNKILVNHSNETEKFNEINFSYSLDNNTGVEKVSYNCEYTLMALKAIKKMKETEVTCYFYGPLRPMLLKGENIEIILLPVRAN